MDPFLIQINAFVEKTKGQMNEVVRGAVFKFAVSIISTSPVGNPNLWKTPAPKGYVGGRFRANWQLGIGAAPVGVLDAIDQSEDGEDTRNKILNDLPKMNAAGKIYWLVNNLPYAERLEKGWSYEQAPNGMVGLAIADWQNIVDKAVIDAAGGPQVWRDQNRFAVSTPQVWSNQGRFNLE